jgi:hypothetical protein
MFFTTHTYICPVMLGIFNFSIKKSCLSKAYKKVWIVLSAGPLIFRLCFFRFLLRILHTRLSSRYEL